MNRLFVSVDDGLSAGIIAGSVSAVVVVIILIVAGVILILHIHRKNRYNVDSPSHETKMEMRSQTYEDPLQSTHSDTVMQQSSAYGVCIAGGERKGLESEIRMQESRAYEVVPSRMAATVFQVA